MPKWTRQRIIRDIIQREAENVALNCGRRHRGVEPSLYQAASRMFGSWQNAVVAAGFPASRARVKHEWTAARILTVIRSLARRRTPLRAEDVRKRYGQLVPAARRCFGSWAKAVYAAGVDPRKLRYRKTWTKEQVLESILLRAIRNEPLRRRSVEPKALADAGTKLFGSWNAALAAAGIDPRAVRLPA